MNFNVKPDAARIEYLKELYKNKKGSPESDTRLKKIYHDIELALGDDWSCLLKQYTERLINNCMNDVDWFYEMGFNDAVTAMSADNSSKHI
jgi:hypothetical protein